MNRVSGDSINQSNTLFGVHLSRNSMDVRQLEYFVAVVEELNFTRAAARCHVAQSALSYQIARLERESGVPLLERGSRSVRVAAAGELLFHRARAVLDELDVAPAQTG